MAREPVSHISRLFFICTLSFSLVLSFGLHSIEVEHVHPGHHPGHYAAGQHSEGTDVINIDEYFHATEQKFFLALLLLIFAGALMANVFRSWGARFVCFISAILMRHRFAYSMRLRFVCRYSTCYLIELFRRGILHPKIF